MWLSAVYRVELGMWLSAVYRVELGMWLFWVYGGVGYVAVCCV